MPAQNPSGSPYAQLRLRFGEFVLGYSLAKPERQPKKITRRGEARLNHSAEGRGVRERREAALAAALGSSDHRERQRGERPLPDSVTG